MYKLFARIAACILLVAAPAQAANFGVSPLSLDLHSQQRSGVVTVTNDDTKPVQIRVRLMRWSQDADGADKYDPSDDLVFFPKRLDLKPGEQKIVRAGINGAPAGSERAYRLFVEELPPAELPSDGQTKLSVLLTFALPIFVAPAPGRSQLASAAAEMTADGRLTLALRNDGSARARISRLLAVDGTPLSDALSARYVFPGTSRTIIAELGAGACSRKISAVKLDLDTSSVEVPVSQTLCKR
ncbi:MAG: molecular chaperone [Burkholderiales bacterium]|nr:molecular chaperone [Burkholderiales bacterium]